MQLAPEARADEEAAGGQHTDDEATVAGGEGGREEGGVGQPECAGLPCIHLPLAARLSLQCR